MAIIYAQLCRKDNNKWVTVSYSDEAPIPCYVEYGAHHDTEEEARAAWLKSDDHARVFLSAQSRYTADQDAAALAGLVKRYTADQDAAALAGLVERYANGEQVEPVEVAAALQAHNHRLGR